MAKPNLDRMGVLVLMSHLIITLSIVVGYIVLSVLNKDVTTFSMLLIAAVSYWFGAMGSNTLRPNSQTQIHNAGEVKVNPEPTATPTDKDVGA
jgi:hypothetical protein